MSCLATLAGYRRTDEAMGNEVIYDFVEQLMRDESSATAAGGAGDEHPRVPLIAAGAAEQSPDERPVVATGPPRIGEDRVVPVAVADEAIEQDRPHTLLMLALAGWIRYLRGTDLKGCTIDIDDPEKELLTKLAAMDGNNPDALLRHEIFAELRVIPGFVDRLRAMITSIDENGVETTLRRSLRDDVQELVS